MTTRMVTEAVEELAARCRQEVDAGLLPSCQFALALDGEVVESRTFGDTPAGDGTRYVMFSATKAIVSATVLQLLGEGSLHLSDRVADHLPEFGVNGKGDVTVEQVMTFRGGFPRAPMGPPAWWTREGRLRTFAEWRLTVEPGTYAYHVTAAHWVLAELIAAIDSIDYRDAIRKRITQPLGLSALRVGVPPDEQGDIARPILVGDPPTEEEFQAVLGVSGIDAGEARDENLAEFARDDLIALGVPGGGATTSAADLALFYQALLHNPDGLWDPVVLADATGNVRVDDFDLVRGVPAGRTIAFLTGGTDGQSGGRGLGHGASPRAFGHDGIGGMLAFADPDTGLSFAYLTNGIDRHILRQQRRARSIATRANQCAEAS